MKSGRKPTDVLTRLMAHIAVADNGCWEFIGSLRQGYGQMKIKRQTKAAHRVAYELLIGPIPVGLDLDHLCRNRRCCNPEHLEPVTRRENLLRGETIPARFASRTHCKAGHELTPDNYYQRRGSHARLCRKCSRNRAAAEQESA